MAVDFNPAAGLRNSTAASNNPRLGQSFGPIDGGIASIADSMASLFGYEDIGGMALERWQNENPGVHLTAQLAGMLIPYAGWELAASKVAIKGGKTLKTIAHGKAARITSNPLGQGFVRNVAVFAPFEAARAVSMLSFGKGIGETARDTGFSLGLAGGVGAAFDGIAAIGRKSKLISGKHPIVQEMNFTPEEWQLLPAQPKLFETQKWLLNNAAMDPDNAKFQAAHLAQRQLINEIMQETIGIAKKVDAFPKKSVWNVQSTFVKELDIGGKLNEVFSINPGANSTKTFLGKVFKPSKSASGGYATFRKNWDKVVDTPINDANLPYLQFPRTGESKFGKGKKGKKGKNKTRDFFNTHLSKLDENTWITREGDDGMYIFAAEKEGKFAVWKTDTPDKWFKAGAEHNASLKNLYHVKTGWGPVQNEKAYKAWVVDKNLAKVSASAQMHLEFKAGITPSLVQFADSSPEAYKGFLKSSTAGKLDWVSDILRKTLAPGNFRFKDPRANIIRASSQTGHQVNVGRLTREVLGKMKKGISLPKAMRDLSKLRDESVFVKTIKQIAKDPKLEKEFVRYSNMLKPVTQAVDDGADELVVAALRIMEGHAVRESNRLIEVQKALGQRPMTRLKEHLGLNRKWDDWVVPVYQDGKKVHVLSAPTKRGAEKLADDFLADARKAGIDDIDTDAPYEGFTGIKNTKAEPEAVLQDMDNNIREALLYGNFESATPELRKFINSTRATVSKKRQDVGGFIENETAGDILENHFKGLMRVAAQENALTVAATYSDELLQLGASNLDEANRLVKELGVMQAGTKPLHQYEEVLNDAMAPLLGKNAAQKVANTLNETMFIGTLGLLNVAYPAITLTSVLTQVFPHVMWLKNAPDARVAKYYRTLGAETRDNRLLGHMSVLDPLKISFSSLSRLRQPDEKLNRVIGEMLDRGMVDQGMLDAVLGTDSVMGNFMNPLKKSGDVNSLLGGVRKGMTYLAERSERFTRLQTIAYATEVGENLFKITDDDKLIDFVSSFLTNTMYSYRTVDRAAAFQGPFGSTVGLFKTWMTNYMSWMAEYAGAPKAGGWQAFAQMNMYSGLIGGIGATPLGQVGDFFSRMTTDHTLSEQLYGRFGEDASDALYFGLPSFMGVSLQGSTALPGANMTRDVEMMFNIASMDMVKAMSSSLGDGLERWYLFGEKPWESQTWRNQFIRATQAKTLYRAQALVQDNAITSLSTGYPALKNPTVADRLAYAAGFNPIDLEREYEAYEVGNRVQERNTKIRRKLAMQFIEANSLTGSERLAAMRSYRNDLQSYPQFDHGSIQRSVDGILKQGELSPTERRIKGDALERAAVIQSSIDLG